MRVFSLGLDEQRQAMVLELYCRKAGGKRKGKTRERFHMNFRIFFILCEKNQNCGGNCTDITSVTHL